MTSGDMARSATDAELAEMGAPSPASEKARRDIANAHRGEVVEGSGVAIEPRELPAVGESGSNVGAGNLLTQPDVASSPDVDAGGAGDEWPTPDTGHTRPDYLGAGRAYWSPSPDADRFADQEGWIRAIDIACAPVVRDRDSLARRCAVRFQQAEQLRADVAQLTAERDEERAKTEGGEWHTETGHYHDGRAWWLPCKEADTFQRRVWVGPATPIEPVTDCEAAP